MAGANMTNCSIKDTTSFDVAIFIIYVPVMLTIAIFGLIGNILCYAILAKEMKPSSTSVLLKSLALADSSVLVTYALYYSIPAIYSSQVILNEYMKFFYVTKQYLWAIMWFCKTMAVYLIVFVSLERYIAVCKPLKAGFICTKRNARMSIICLVILSVVYNSPKTLYYYSVWVYDECVGKLRPVSRRSDIVLDPHFYYIYVITLYFIILFIVPLGIMIFCNIQLKRALGHATTVRTNTMRAGKASRKQRQQSDSITMRIIAVVTVFLVLEFPAIILNVLYAINKEISFMDASLLYNILRVSYVLSTINSFINFYVYCLTGSNFRRTAIKMFQRRKASKPKVKNSPRVFCLSSGKVQKPLYPPTISPTLSRSGVSTSPQTSVEDLYVDVHF
ncbi:FMRFamide receptor-like [Lineus longissimus]|uniref:FMRFamide receptor-like n=1 Tax=Lineus longissimus TaxID=88925 RepID=UPI00315CE692